MIFTQSIERRINSLIKEYGKVALNKLNDLNARQQSLELEDIFQPEKLMSGDFRTGVHEKLDNLNALLEEYNKFYSDYIVKFHADLLNITKELPRWIILKKL